MLKFWISITFLIIISIPTLIHFSYGADYQTWSDIATVYKISDNWRYDGGSSRQGYNPTGESPVMPIA